MALGEPWPLYGCIHWIGPGCPHCHPLGHYSPPQPPGCICPPGAEKTCQGPSCPRRRIVTDYGLAGHTSEPVT